MLDQLARIWGETGRESAFARGLDLKVFSSLGPQSGVAAELIAAAQTAQAAQADEAAKAAEFAQALAVEARAARAAEAAKAAESARALAVGEARAAQASLEVRRLKRALAVMAIFVLVTLSLVLFGAYQLSKAKRDVAVAEVVMNQERAQWMKTLGERKLEGTASSANGKELEKLTQQFKSATDQFTENLGKAQDESARLRTENDTLKAELVKLRESLPRDPVPPTKQNVPPVELQTVPQPRVCFEVPNSDLRDLARGLTASLTDKGFRVDPQIGSGGSGKESEVKYYFPGDKAIADQLVDLLEELGVSNLGAASLARAPREVLPGQFDVSLAAGASHASDANVAKREGETGWVFAGNYDIKSRQWTHRALNGLTGLPEKGATYSSSIQIRFRTTSAKKGQPLPPYKGEAFPRDWRFRVLTVRPRPGDDAVWCEVVAESPATPLGQGKKPL
jgi:hypothetical protein